MNRSYKKVLGKNDWDRVVSYKQILSGGYTWEYSDDLSCGYLTVTDCEVVSSKEVATGIIVDLDAADQVVGIEFMARSAIDKPTAGRFSEREAAAKAPGSRSELLDEARGLVCGEKEAEYGPPAVNLNRIAELWNVYLRARIGDQLEVDEFGQPVFSLDGRDVAILMILHKCSREAAGRKHDTPVDIIGYASMCEEAER